MNIQELYSNKDYCLDELKQARSIFTNKKSFTTETAKGLSKGLGLMYLYCPEEIQDLVLSYLDELSIRELFI